jgi:hypothetical protein
VGEYDENEIIVLYCDYYSCDLIIGYLIGNIVGLLVII